MGHISYAWRCADCISSAEILWCSSGKADDDTSWHAVNVNTKACLVRGKEQACAQVCGLIGGCSGVINTGDNFYGELPAPAWYSSRILPPATLQDAMLRASNDMSGIDSGSLSPMSAKPDSVHHRYTLNTTLQPYSLGYALKCAHVCILRGCTRFFHTRRHSVEFSQVNLSDLSR